DLGELDAAAAEGRVVLAAEHVVDEPLRADLDVADLLEQLAGDHGRRRGVGGVEETKSRGRLGCLTLSSARRIPGSPIRSRRCPPSPSSSSPAPTATTTPTTPPSTSSGRTPGSCGTRRSPSARPTSSSCPGGSPTVTTSGRAPSRG